MEEKIAIKHSKLGIISFLIALIFIIHLLVTAYIDIMHVFNSDSLLNTNEFNMFFFISLFMHPIGVILGFIAVLQKDTKKTFASIGLTVNFLMTVFIYF